MSIRERILNFIEFKGISKYLFYKQTGISNGFLDKAGAVGSDKCEIICSCYPDLNPEWLIIGEGSMIKSKVNKTGHVNAADTAENRLMNLLIEKIVSLTAENTILKQENEALKSKKSL